MNIFFIIRRIPISIKLVKLYTLHRAFFQYSTSTCLCINIEMIKPKMLTWNMMYFYVIFFFTGVVLHNFPNPSTHYDKFRTWVINAGLVGEDDDYVFRCRRICHLHFEQIHHYPKNRLSRLAVPTLHLPGMMKLLFIFCSLRSWLCTDQ